MKRRSNELTRSGQRLSGVRGNILVDGFCGFRLWRLHFLRVFLGFAQSAEIGRAGCGRLNIVQLGRAQGDGAVLIHPELFTRRQE